MSKNLLAVRGAEVVFPPYLKGIKDFYAALIGTINNLAPSTDDISTPGFRRLALSQRNKPFRFFILDLAHCLQWQTCMVNSVTGSLEKYMDVLAARQKLVAANIANADTPGYRTQDIDFQTELKNRLDGTPNIGGQEVSGLRVKNDGNNVSLDREARLLSENSIRFNAASNLLKGQLRIMKSAIHDGQS